MTDQDLPASAPIAPLDRQQVTLDGPSLKALREATEAGSGTGKDWERIFQDFAEIKQGLTAYSALPRDERRGFAMSEAKLAAIGMILGPILGALSSYVDGPASHWLGVIGAVLVGGSALGYPVSRGMAKGAVGRMPQVLIFLALGGALLGGGLACKGPGGDTSYIRRDKVGPSLEYALDRHDAWGALLVKAGQLDPQKYGSAVRQSAQIRALMSDADVMDSIAIPEAPELTAPPLEPVSEPVSEEPPTGPAPPPGLAPPTGSVTPAGLAPSLPDPYASYPLVEPG